MNQQYKKAFVFAVIICITIAFPILASAQTDIDPVPGDPDETVPIDGGLSLLLAAGVGYGAKKMKAKRASSANKS